MGPKMGAKNQPSAVEDPLKDLLPDEEDLLYEEELLRNPYNLKMWLRYLGARKGASPKKRYILYERALQALPGSYKVRKDINRIFYDAETLQFSVLRRKKFLITSHLISPLSHFLFFFSICSFGALTYSNGLNQSAVYPSTTLT